MINHQKWLHIGPFIRKNYVLFHVYCQFNNNSRVLSQFLFFISQRTLYFGHPKLTNLSFRNCVLIFGDIQFVQQFYYFCFEFLI